MWSLGLPQGLGEATARIAIQQGAKAVLVDLNPGGAEIAKALGDAAIFIQADITQEAAARDAIELASKRFGGVNVLVNCAGIAPSERIVGRTGVHGLDTFARTITGEPHRYIQYVEASGQRYVKERSE